MRDSGRAFASGTGWGCNLALLSALILILPIAAPKASQPLSDETLARIEFKQNLNAQVNGTLSFRDEAGRPVQLGSYFGKKPVILVLGYYRCPMLCTFVLNGLVESLEDLKWSIGHEFEVIDVSIDPSESPTLAAAKKTTYLKRYGRSGAAEGWHFLTGTAPAIRELADQVGFAYAFDASTGQFAHPSGLVILTPEGKIARYFLGMTFAPDQLYTALSQAAANRIGSPIEQLVLLCFHYNPIRGKYGATIMRVIRVLGVLTMIGLGAVILKMARHNSSSSAEPSRLLTEAPAMPTGPSEPAP